MLTQVAVDSTHTFVHSSKLVVASSHSSAWRLDLRVLAASVLSAPRLTRTPSRSSLRDIPSEVDTGLADTEDDQIGVTRTKAGDAALTALSHV